ncbi:MAG: hypothetical protein KA214_03150 [Neisseriaceae bacterium]|nr:hypothetical protein [Neisseriaceae bacterium]
MIIRIIFFAFIVFLVYRVANMAWQSLQAQKQADAPKPPRSVNDWPQTSAPEDGLLSEPDEAEDHGYWQRKIQDAYRQGYKDGLDDGKSQNDGL